MHSFKVTPVILIVDYGGTSIATARGRWTPEVTLPVDRAITVSYSCFADIYRLSCTISTLLALLLLPKMAERRFRPLWGVSRPEVKSPFDSLTVAFGMFRLSFTCPKLFDFFDWHVKCRLKILGMGYSHGKQLFSWLRPPKGTSLEQAASLDASCVQIGSVVWSVGLVTKEKEVR
jgi:hypothetical protein